MIADALTTAVTSRLFLTAMHLAAAVFVVAVVRKARAAR